MKLKFDRIRIDGGTQTRAKLNEQFVAQYRDDIKNGDQFPPVTVFYDGADYWLADGFHRYRAYVENQIFEFEADVRQGSRRDAILYSVRANAEHGLPRTNEDKRRAVTALLGDDEWGLWSDSQIAKACAVSQRFVSGVRGSLRTVSSDANTVKHDTCRKFITKHGTQAVMNTTKIGKKHVSQSPGKVSKKALTPVRGHSTPGPRIIEVSLALDNPEASACGVMSHCSIEFIKPFAEILLSLVNEELQNQEN